eukprot:scaffold101200_cov38-Prasinocladus_malaysianus.AAC.1
MSQVLVCGSDMTTCRQAEPALLVGETGSGKTTVCQMASLVRGQKLHIINCNRHTEASDFLGGFRPVRERERALSRARLALQRLVALPHWDTFGLERPPAELGVASLWDVAVPAARALLAASALGEKGAEVSDTYRQRLELHLTTDITTLPKGGHLLCA